ncbi:DNA translocase FtsK [Dyella soli]|uniref:DNA translocase FtsK n=1 Tax=Dyella soli TaxID=522319 RepID=A0A4R0YND5_9GAMM|nr:DNA translocase FtsK [Dyella soli]TCI09067.1 DNA translocase FtsK [Dyella soli]
MLTFFFGGFGLSTLWLIPLFWRVGRALVARRKRSAGGEGTIRFCLGALSVLLASATLEGLVVDLCTDDPQAGGSLCRALSHAFGGLMGAPLTGLSMLLVLAAALPWYPGWPWAVVFRRVSRLVDLLAVLLQRGVDFVSARFGMPTRSPRARGAVRRRDAVATTGRRTAQAAVRQPPSATAPVTAPAVERPTPAAPSLLASRPRSAVAREPVIREPWLLPKSARAAPSLPATPVARAMPAPSPAMPVVTRAPVPVVAEAAGQAAAMAAPVVVASAIAAPAQHPTVAPVVEDPPLPAETVEPLAEGAWSEAEPEPAPLSDYVRPAALAPGRRLAANDDQLAAPVCASEPAVRAAPRERSGAMLPPLSLLATARLEVAGVDDAQLAETSELIEQRLREFKVPVTVVGASAGPVITRFEVEPAVGVRGNQIVALMKDLARGLGRTSVRVVETIPGKTCMGLELPNEQRQMIALSEILDSAEYRGSESLLTLAMGKGITGDPVVADLAKAPHMLVAGTTGSGKSVAVNAMILSMLYKATPDDVRMIMIDPKMLELSVYEGIPHLLAPVVTDMKLAANALAWCVAEMENRYRVMSDLRVRNLAGFNQKVREARAAGRPLMNPFSAHPEVPELLDTLPMIVVVIDELADLMMVAGKKIEELIARLAQKARAAGIHLILATQRPSVDVITGLIKANIPTRVAFQVSSKIDSRTILDQMGAESLLGQGDMLFLPPGTGYPQRIHGAFVADEEVHRVVSHLKQYGEPDYKDEILAGPPGEGSGELFGEDGADAELDPLYDEAAAFVLRTRRASISFVQRQFRIGYNRAARLVEAMEAAGLVSSMGINGQRDVIAPGPVD